MGSFCGNGSLISPIAGTAAGRMAIQLLRSTPPSILVSGKSNRATTEPQALHWSRKYLKDATTPLGSHARHASRIELATLDDLSDIAQVAKEVCAENGPQLPGGGRVGFDVETFSARLADGLRDKSMLAGLVREDGDIAAAILLEVSRFWYSPNGRFLTEHFVYVRPGKRRSRHAFALLEFAKTSAATLNLPLYVGVMTASRGEAKARLYRRVFGTPYGAYFAFNTGG